MGLGGISIWQLLIILAIVIMLFGTKRLRNLGSDLGTAVKGFRKSIQDDDNGSVEPPAASDTEAKDKDQTRQDDSKEK
ncbi:twin-arginine translocase TatA/TatE family subunit [Parahaliea sp. F7430]|uniref:Sec-independent protein translocase protein TatA n=1 Tax=Sediminihaliea albiluteola TaxID=2758564 RepID=A0A7W2YKP5_9GAMM|nr:twin-arginine translocase TatA/TatE family subunit [Sediminihaliea albiluteola]MBA6413929.1 twin-arginine translocase TatA/TatE family subunit [Sediminihaliea albiluteola]